MALRPPRGRPAVAPPGRGLGGAARAGRPGAADGDGLPDAGDDSTGATHRRAYDLLAEGFGPGFNAPLLLVADLRRPGVDARAIPALSEQIAADPGIAMVGEPRTSPGGDTVVLPTIPTTAPADAATSATLERVRDLAPANVAVSGLTAMTDDLTTQLADTLPIFIAAILAASFLLLMVVFRSIVVPLKAAVMNLLSIGGAYGVVVAVFQWGWLGDLFNLEGTFLIASPMPPSSSRSCSACPWTTRCSCSRASARPTTPPATTSSRWPAARRPPAG